MPFPRETCMEFSQLKSKQFAKDWNTASLDFLLPKSQERQLCTVVSHQKSRCCASLYRRGGEGLSIVWAGLFVRGLRSVCTAIQIAMYELTVRHFHRLLFKGDLEKAIFCFHLFLIGYALFCFLVKYEYICVYIAAIHSNMLHNHFKLEFKVVFWLIIKAFFSAKYKPVTVIK